MQSIVGIFQIEFAPKHIELTLNKCIDCVTLALPNIMLVKIRWSKMMILCHSKYQLKKCANSSCNTSYSRSHKLPKLHTMSSLIPINT